MKGISTLLAAILLIAFTVAAGGIISVWITGFTRSTTGGVEATTANQTKCAGVYISVDSVGSAVIIYSNPSGQILTGIKAITNTGATVNITNDTLNPAGQSVGFWSSTGNTSVIFKGLCRASVPVQGSCQSGDNCWVA